MYKILNCSSQVIPLTLEVGSIVMRPGQSFDLEDHCSREFIANSVELDSFKRAGVLAVIHDSEVTLSKPMIKSPFQVKNTAGVPSIHSRVHSSLTRKVPTGVSEDTVKHSVKRPATPITAVSHPVPKKTIKPVIIDLEKIPDHVWDEPVVEVPVVAKEESIVEPVVEEPVVEEPVVEEPVVEEPVVEEQKESEESVEEEPVSRKKRKYTRRKKLKNKVKDEEDTEE